MTFLDVYLLTPTMRALPYSFVFRKKVSLNYLIDHTYDIENYTFMSFMTSVLKYHTHQGLVLTEQVYDLK